MKKVLVGVLAVLLIILVGIGGYIYKIIGALSDMDNSPIIWDENPGDFGIPESAPIEEDTGTINILLLGTDRRNRNENGRSDAIMIATVDKKNGQLKLSSIMRDLYVSIPDRKDNRINAAYSFGGPMLAMKTINQNFNLNITRYVSVDFFGLEEIINAIGGVEIDVKQKEIKYINSVINELNKLDKQNRTSPQLTEAGVQTLDGKQAVAYSRIRKVGDGDSERTERQRRVMTQIFNQMKSINPMKLPNLVASLIPYTDTNIPASDIISLGTTVLTMKDKKIYQYRVPAKDTYKSQTIRGMAVYVPDLDANTKQLHDFLYNKVTE
ncbi:MAG: LCP family protein [Clostridiales bacterium]|jgi:LCP family protein required for cell wall assembly|nr:LCP family protein [Clostridiales bacterium]